MKQFKNILNTLLENEYLDVGTAFNGYSDPTPRSAHSDAGVYRDDSAQINRIHAFANAFLNGGVIEPSATMKMLRAKINHAGLDFEFNNKTPLKIGRNVFQLNRWGEVFGATPTTDLMKGFDRGVDIVPLALTFDLQKSPNGKYYFSNVMINKSGMTDEIETKIPSPEVRESFDESGELLLESSDMHVSLVNMAMKNPEIKTKVLDPLFKGIMTKKLTGQEKAGRLDFAARSVIRRLHKAGKIDRGTLSPNIHSMVSAEFKRRVKAMKTLSNG
jgi:hypothetical protein